MSKISIDEYRKLKDIKHPADLTVNDVIYLDDGNGFLVKDKTFNRVVCDGYCGKDEFYGYIEETGRRTSWSDADMFKIVGTEIKIKFNQGTGDERSVATKAQSGLQKPETK